MQRYTFRAGGAVNAGTLTLLCLCLAMYARLPAAERYRPFLGGDVDENGFLEMTDSVRVLGFLFLGTPDRSPLR